jgi:hypothetical protein
MKAASVGQFKVYSLQRQFTAFLENAGLCEEGVPGGRGDVIGQKGMESDNVEER